MARIILRREDNRDAECADDDALTLISDALASGHATYGFVHGDAALILRVGRATREAVAAQEQIASANALVDHEAREAAERYAAAKVEARTCPECSGEYALPLDGDPSRTCPHCGASAGERPGAEPAENRAYDADAFGDVAASAEGCPLHLDATAYDGRVYECRDATHLREALAGMIASAACAGESVRVHARPYRAADDPVAYRVYAPETIANGSGR